MHAFRCSVVVQFVNIIRFLWIVQWCNKRQLPPQIRNAGPFYNLFLFIHVSRLSSPSFGSLGVRGKSAPGSVPLSSSILTPEIRRHLQIKPTRFSTGGSTVQSNADGSRPGLKMECNYFTCIVELVLPPLARAGQYICDQYAHVTCFQSCSVSYIYKT